MHKLEGLNVGDQIIEFFGPINVQNRYDTTIAPQLQIQVFGTGSVNVQQTQTSMFIATGGQPNINAGADLAADQSTYANVTTNINQASGKTNVTLTANNYNNFVRIVVNTTGTGRVAIKSQWR